MHAGGCRNPARISQSNFCPVNTSCIIKNNNKKNTNKNNNEKRTTQPIC